MQTEDVLLAFRRNLANARSEAGLNRAELARRSGLAHSVIRRIETGERQPLLATIAQLARALGTTPADLLSLPEDPPRRVGVSRFAAIRGVSTGRIRRLAIDGRIEGAVKAGTRWEMPQNARILPAKPKSFSKL